MEILEKFAFFGHFSVSYESKLLKIKHESMPFFVVSAQTRTWRDEAGQSPIIKDVYSSLLKHVMNCLSLFIIHPLRDCGSSRFTRPSLSILRLRDDRSSRFNLGWDRFYLTAKNQTIGDDTNWKKKNGYHVLSSQCSSVRFIEYRMITVINDVFA